MPRNNPAGIEPDNEEQPLNVEKNIDFAGAPDIQMLSD